MIDDHSCDCHAECGGDVTERTINLRLGRAVFTVRAHVLHWLFYAINALELAARESLVLLEFLAKGSCQRVAINLPELSLSYHEGVASKGCSHRRNEGDFLRKGCGTENQIRLVFQRVDGIDDEVVFLQVELIGCFRLVDFLISRDVGIWVDFQQAFAQRIYFHLSDGTA